MNKFKIGIIGCGKLGAPCGNVFAEAGHDVIGLDPNPNPEVRFPMVSGMMELLKDRDIVFIAVPTPHAEEYGGEKPTSHLPSRGFDISIVDSVFSEIHAAGVELNLEKWPTIALISTVLPGTCRNVLDLDVYPFDVVYNPYLIAMGSVEWDMKNPDLIIFGTKTGQFPEVVFDEDGKLVLDDPVCKLMVLYDQLIENHDTFDNGTLHYSKWTLGTWEEAEATKIYYNTFISAKIAFVNMIQDTAMAVGNMNVDVVTNNIFLSEKRILSTAYTKAGMGDAGACHVRDCIALSSFAKEYVLCYDFFGNLNNVREQQAKNLAFFLADQARAHNLPVIIHGKAYKPGVTYTDGSYSLLVGHYVEQITGEKPIYVDPLTGDTVESMLGVILMAHSASTTYSHTVTIGSPEQRLYAPIEPGSVIIDIWRELNPEALPGCTIIQYGNTRQGEFIRPSQD